jgi:AraC-like DNA-binding protein
MAGRISEQVAGRPRPRLRPHVDGYVGYRLAGFEPGVHAGLPSRKLTFIVSFGAPVDIVAMPDPAQRPDRFWSLVGGLHTAPAMIRHDGNQHGVQLGITPLGARALFGMPPAELASSVITMDDVLGPLTTELVDRLAAATHWYERFAVLDDVLERAIAPVRDPSPELTRAWDELARTGGTIDVESVARDVGWSRRHLSERFRVEFGHGPKAMARVMRFERARSKLVTPGVTIARVAAECGYADQAHLAREWRELAGQSPTAWLANEHLPFVQDEAVPLTSG